MTSNQLRFHELKEAIRSNKAKEQHNTSTLAENIRHNLVGEQETNRHNLVGETETNRSNRAKELETVRHNLETEDFARDKQSMDVLLKKIDQSIDHMNANSKSVEVDVKILDQIRKVLAPLINSAWS